MRPLSDFQAKVQYVLTDIDDTLTYGGQLPAESYKALWDLKNAGIKVIPITGRPAGWCEMIARLWPVEGIVGENGAFYFRYFNKKMHRAFVVTTQELTESRKKLDAIRDEILAKVPGTAVASDQFCRINDLAIDFCEDVKPLPTDAVKQIVQIFENHGATAKVSSIHVNGWFGNCNKLTTSIKFLKDEFQLKNMEILRTCAFVGDSPNDEPMYAHFKHTFGVANINHFKNEMKFLPAYVSKKEGGYGFQEIAERLLKI